MGDVVLAIMMMVPGILLMAVVGAGLLWCVELRLKPRRVSEKAVVISAFIEVVAIHVWGGFTSAGGFRDVLLFTPVSVPLSLAICALSNLGIKAIYDRRHRERSA